MQGASSVEGGHSTSWQKNNQDINTEQEWEKNLNQPNLDAEGLPKDVQKVVGDMIGNMAIEAIKMHNPAKKISLSGDD